MRVLKHFSQKKTLLAPLSLFILSFTFPFILSLLFHLVSCFLFHLLLSSCLVSSLVLLLISSSLLFHLLSSLLFSLLSFLLCLSSFIFSCLLVLYRLLLSFLVLSLFHCLRVMLCVVWCGVCRCGRGVVGGRGVCLVFVCVCVCLCVFVCCGTLKKKTWKNQYLASKSASVCTFKTSPCMPTPRAHVFYTCGHVAGTHGTF